MNPSKETLHLQLLGKPYTLVCAADELTRVKEAAQYLDQKVSVLQQQHRQTSLERLALMVALDIADELLTQRAESLDYRDTLESKVRALTATLASALEPVFNE